MFHCDHLWHLAFHLNKTLLVISSITLKMSVLDHLHRSLSIIYIKIPLFNSNCSYHVGPEKPQALPLLSDFDK